MAYLPNIPQPGDLLATSQGNLLGNFQAIKTLVDVNHVDFASSDQGKHFVVAMPVQSASPPSGYTFLAGEVGLYNFNNATTGVNEMYIHTAGNKEVPITASNQASTGWCYLPSGLILKWGTATMSGFTISVPVNGGGLGPNFTNIFQVFLTNTFTLSTVNAILSYDSATLIPNIDVFSSVANASFSYFAIGN